MQYCKPQVLLGKGYHLTIEGIRKGLLFLYWYMKGSQDELRLLSLK